MLFSSVEFIFVFLPLSLISYFVVPTRLKNFVLFIFSLLFYGWGEPIYLFLMLFTIATDYLFGILIEKKPSKSKFFLWSAVISNLLILAFFKYLSPTLNLFGIDFKDIALPVGISFYTFQSLSYVADVYNGEKAQQNLIDFGTYITMFPQLVAGPIIKYDNVASQLNFRTHSAEKASAGILRFVVGLSKKLIFANGAGKMWLLFSGRPFDELSSVGAWAGILFFAFQIYFDFSGYSDMAIGLGLIFGFEFPENFNYPYTAVSIKDFWHRWHISLSTWFKEYVYIPLGGNRKGLHRTLFNMLVVWIFTGIWHGANFTFLAWGLYYFFILAAEKLFLGRLLEKLPKFAAHLYSLFFILIGWVFFASENLTNSVLYLQRLFSFTPPAKIELYHIVRNIPFILLLAIGATKIPHDAYISLTRRNESRKFVFSLCSMPLFVLCIANLISSSYNPFLYFRF